MVAPALNAIAKEFNITNEVESQLVLSIFVLAFAIGPLFWAPLSEARAPEINSVAIVLTHAVRSLGGLPFCNLPTCFTWCSTLPVVLVRARAR